MLCERCQKTPATVHVDEVQAFHGPGNPDNKVAQQHLCEACAQTADLPNVAVQQKTMDEVWKLLQMSALKSHKKPAAQPLTCGDCGMTLDALRRKGRVGCAACYTVFAQYLTGLLERMHGSTEHVGRLPEGAAEAHAEAVASSAGPSVDEGVAQGGPTGGPVPASSPKAEADAPAESAAESAAESPARMRARMADELQRAINEEDFERAAELRDELARLDAEQGAAAAGDDASSPG